MIDTTLPYVRKPSFVSKLLNGGAWALAGKLSTLPLSILFTSLSTRLLTPDAMGTYIYVQSIVTAAAVLSLLGLGQTAVRIIAGPLGQGDRAAVQANLVKVIQWGLIGISVAVALLFVGQSYFALPKTVHMLLVLWVVIFALQKLFAELFRGFHDIRTSVLTAGGTIGGTITYIVGMGIVFTAWFTHSTMDVERLLLVVICGGVISVIWALWSFSKLLRTHHMTTMTWYTFPSMSLLWLAAPLLVHDVTTILTNQSGLWILQIFSTSSDIALYGIATRLVALIVVPLNIVNSFVAPTIADLYYKGQRKQLEDLLRMLATFSSIPAWLALGLFLTFGREVLGLLFGNYYQSAVLILIILTFGNAINVSAGSCGLLLVMAGHQSVLMWISITSGLVSVALTAVCIKWAGAAGAALAFTVIITAKNLAMLYITKHLTGIWTHVSLNRQLLSTQFLS